MAGTSLATLSLPQLRFLPTPSLCTPTPPAAAKPRPEAAPQGPTRTRRLGGAGARDEPLHTRLEAVQGLTAHSAGGRGGLSRRCLPGHGPADGSPDHVLPPAGQGAFCRQGSPVALAGGTHPAPAARPGFLCRAFTGGILEEQCLEALGRFISWERSRIAIPSGLGSGGAGSPGVLLPTPSWLFSWDPRDLLQLGRSVPLRQLLPQNCWRGCITPSSTLGTLLAIRTCRGNTCFHRLLPGQSRELGRDASLRSRSAAGRGYILPLAARAAGLLLAQAPLGIQTGRQQLDTAPPSG